MAEESYSIQQLLTLRKLTRSVGDLLRGQLNDYLTALVPVLRARNVLGEYVHGGSKEGNRGAEKIFLELQKQYSAVGASKPFHLTNELKAPFEISSSAVELTPVEYSYQAKSGDHAKTVLVTSPLKWMVFYTGFAPKKLKELLGSTNPLNEDVHRFILHYLVLHALVTSQPGISKLFEGLRFPISFGQSAAFGALPLMYISSCVSTVRPPDDVLIESTEISGQNAFEEVIHLDDLRDLQDPLKNQLLELAQKHGESPAMTAAR
jgi:hypothetical protein